MKKTLLFLLILTGVSQAQSWGNRGGLFYWSINGGTRKTDSLRIAFGSGASGSVSGNVLTLSATGTGATIANVRDSSGWYRFGTTTKLVNSTNSVTKNIGIDMSGAQPVMNFYASDGDVTSFTVGTSDQMIWSGASGGYSYSNGGIFLGSATGGNKGAGTINATTLYDDNVQLVAPPFDSTHVTDGALTSADYRAASVGATALAPTAVTAGSYTNPILTIDADGRITAAVPGPIRFSVDSASAMACDTMLVWQNITGATITVDSINVAARTDDYAISIIKCDYNGKNGALIDAVTASTNGTNLYFITDASITSASVENGKWIGFKRPASTGEGVFVRIHYH